MSVGRELDWRPGNRLRREWHNAHGYIFVGMPLDPLQAPHTASAVCCREGNRELVCRVIHNVSRGQ